MGKPSGYKAYSIYLMTKYTHFNSKNKDMMKQTYSKKYLDKWNTERVNKDGFMFQEVHEKYNNIKALKILMASYYMYNPDFYIKEPIEDNYKVFKDNLIYLRDVENKFTKEFEYIILESNGKIKDLLIGNGNIPKIFKMDISWNTLTIINKCFDIKKLNKGFQITSFERSKYNALIKRLTKYELIIDEFTKDINWKKLIKEIVML
jgi:hypothetical protein